ncbi:vacuolar protein sorting-associated protein 35 [bacterium]|nr:vacuolar protein sorting-associated protein 35 [bacterium]
MAEEEVDQEKILDEALLIVKSQGYQMKVAIENNKLRNSLKFAKAMLDTLKSTTLSPSNYYQLFLSIFDEMQYIFNYFREEARRGRRMKDLYDTVQQCENIIPRLFLLICVASAYIETGQTNATDIIFDLFNLIKGVQNPLRGLFCRYFFLKMIKDRLPDKGNEYEKPGASPDDTVKFILNNLEEMNGLWIRITNNNAIINGEDDNVDIISSLKEREQLKILIGENITRLSSLNCVNVDVYQKKVLPKIIEILLESKDSLSQQYLLECVVHAFPDEHNIACMNVLLDTCSKLQSNVDVKTIFISLMQKLAKYVENSKDEKNIIDSAQKIFSIVKGNINKIMNESSSNMDINKLIELQVAFLNFTLKCCPEKERLDSTNNILTDSVNLLSKNKSEIISNDTIKLIGRLLSVPLESNMSIFSMNTFPELMRYLDYASRATLSLRIIDSLVNESSTVKLDNSEKVSALMDFIRPLLEDSPDAGEYDQYQFEYEQASVCKLLFIISTNDPQNMYDILNVLKNTFLKGGIKRQKFTLSALVNAYITLSYKISYALNKINGVEDSRKEKIHEDFVNYYNLKGLDTNEQIHKFMKRIYSQINDTISIIENDFSDMAIKLYLSLAIQINDIKVDKNLYEEICYNSLSSAIQIFNKGKINDEIKVDLINQVIGTILNINILSRDDLVAITSNIVQVSQSLLKRSDQCLAILNCTHLYYKTLVEDSNKIIDCLNKAKKFADYAMTNPKNAILFIKIINKYLFFIEKSENDESIDFINPETINDLIELVKNHIQSMKIENKDAEFLPVIEEYYNNTIYLMNQGRKEGKYKILESLSI